MSALSMSKSPGTNGTRPALRARDTKSHRHRLRNAAVDCGMSTQFVQAIGHSEHGIRCTCDHKCLHLRGGGSLREGPE